MLILYDDIKRPCDQRSSLCLLRLCRCLMANPFFPCFISDRVHKEPRGAARVESANVLALCGDHDRVDCFFSLEFFYFFFGFVLLKRKRKFIWVLSELMQAAIKRSCYTS